MKSIQFAHASVFSFVLLMMGCGGGSSSSEPEEPAVTVDTILPSINCPSNILDAVESTQTGKNIVFTAPVGTDNLAGASTSQTAGLASNAFYPAGITVNTFRVTDTAGNTASCSFTVTIDTNEPSENAPYFIVADPAPSGQTWVKVEDLSDEFSDDTLDTNKWQNTDPGRWIGRPPGLFVADTVSLAEGNLRLTAYALAEPRVVNGNTFTHAGSNIYSNSASQVGDYIEARMKASKTFMSSTFWLINNRGDGTGCDRRVTELDIQEAVGQITGTANFAQTFDETIHSNTHSRQADCDETPLGSAGNSAFIGEKVWEDFNVYGAWWKSPQEIEFYLNGEHVYTVNPVADFDLPLFLRLVVETYDWNPVPEDGGMNLTEEERTTFYDWVRTWRLQ